MASLKDMKEGPAKTGSYLSHDEIKEVIRQQKERKTSPIVAGIYGVDGTAKTGIALNIRTQEDIDAGRPLYIVDFDYGVKPLLEEYYCVRDSEGNPIKDNNGNREIENGIVLLDPVVRHDDGEKRGAINPIETIRMTMSMLYFIYEEGEGESSGVIMDGMDTWLKDCEYYMREDALKIDAMATTSQTNWYIRDQKHDQALILAKSLPCPTIFITHLKDKMAYVDKQLTTIDTYPKWGELCNSQVYQKIECFKKEKQNTLELWARVNKAKGKLYLEGHEYKIATIPNKGLKEDAVWESFDWSIFK